MEIYERIRYLRKTVLNMSQEEFGNRLGVNRSVIKNIELNLLARPEQKEPLYKLICKEFSVSYEWLTTGEGEICVESKETIIDKLSKQYGLSRYAQKILEFYISLNKDKRDELDVFIDSFAHFIIKDETAVNADKSRNSVIDNAIERVDAWRTASSSDEHSPELSVVAIPENLTDIIESEDDL